MNTLQNGPDQSRSKKSPLCLNDDQADSPPETRYSPQFPALHVCQLCAAIDQTRPSIPFGSMRTGPRSRYVRLTAPAQARAQSARHLFVYDPGIHLRPLPFFLARLPVPIRDLHGKSWMRTCSKGSQVRDCDMATLRQSGSLATYPFIGIDCARVRKVLGSEMAEATF